MAKDPDAQLPPDDAAPAAPEAVTEAAPVADVSAAPVDGPVQGKTVNPNTEDSPLNQNGYAGTDPVYQNAANETELPL